MLGAAWTWLCAVVDKVLTVTLRLFCVFGAGEIRNPPRNLSLPIGATKARHTATSPLVNPLPLYSTPHHAQQYLYKLPSHHNTPTPRVINAHSILLRDRTHSHTSTQELHPNTSDEPESQPKRITHGAYSREATWRKRPELTPSYSGFCC